MVPGSLPWLSSDANERDVVCGEIVVEIMVVVPPDFLLSLLEPSNFQSVQAKPMYLGVLGQRWDQDEAWWRDCSHWGWKAGSQQSKLSLLRSCRHVCCSNLSFSGFTGLTLALNTFPIIKVTFNTDLFLMVYLLCGFGWGRYIQVIWLLWVILVVSVVFVIFKV